MLQGEVAEAFLACERDGWAFCAGAVANVRALVDELADVELRPLESNVGVVTQAGFSGVTAIEGRPLLAELADELASLSEGWRPDEVAIGRYGVDGGISAHRDNSFYTGFVVVLTVSGEARFRVLGDREGHRVLADVTARPGDLALLRGPRGSGDDRPDARPLHSVGPPANGMERTVLVLRQNARGAGKGWT